MRIGVPAVAVFVLCGCRNDSAHTELQPNASGVVLSIGSRCKAEDGWRYMYPPGWPTMTIVSDAGLLIPPPIPPDYKETFQLPPGVGYCMVDPVTAPDGFFTSNCQRDRDCPEGSRCDSINHCNLPCASDADCRPGFVCATAKTRARFCAQGCPVSPPEPHFGCYEYRGPRACYYPENVGAGGPASVRTLCRCVPKPQNSAEWECAAEDACPPSPPGQTPCRLPSAGELVCRYDQYGETRTCRCLGTEFSCEGSSGPHPIVDASATTER
jgi:hypothetical protein